MALLLQCLRDVRTQTGDLDMLPPVNHDGSLDHGRPQRQRGGLEEAARRSAFEPPPIAPRLHGELAEASH